MVFVSLFGYYNFFNSKGFKKAEGIVSSVAETIVPEKVVKKDLINDEKVGELNTVLAKYPDYITAISVINLNNGKKYHVGTAEPFTAASTTKVISGICYLRRVEMGYASLEGKLGSSTGEFQLKQMINRSNNISWDLINKKIGYSNLRSCAREIGAGSYNFYNNTVTPDDMSYILSRLSNNELLTKTNTDLLLSYMQNTNEERMIPASTPEGYIVYHKYGIFGGNLHDIGIIDGRGEKYAIAIYTDGPGLGEAQLEARLSFYKEILGIIFKEI